MKRVPLILLLVLVLVSLALATFWRGSAPGDEVSQVSPPPPTASPTRANQRPPRMTHPDRRVERFEEIVLQVDLVRARPQERDEVINFWRRGLERRHVTAADEKIALALRKLEDMGRLDDRAYGLQRRDIALGIFDTLRARSDAPDTSRRRQRMKATDGGWSGVPLRNPLSEGWRQTARLDAP